MIILPSTASSHNWKIAYKLHIQTHDYRYIAIDYLTSAYSYKIACNFINNKQKSVKRSIPSLIRILHNIICNPFSHSLQSIVISYRFNVLIHRRRELFNIGGGGGQTQRSQLQYLRGGGIAKSTYTHVCTHMC